MKNKMKFIFFSMLIAFSSLQPLSVNAVSRYTIETIDNKGGYTIINNYEDYNSAKEDFIKNSDQNLVIKDSQSKSPSKIVEMKSGQVQSYPYRTGAISATGKSADMLLYMFVSPSMSGDRTYIPAHYKMYYMGTEKHSSGNLMAKVQISGFTGYVDLQKIDLIPNIIMSSGIKFSIGGNENYYSSPESSVNMVIEPDTYSVNYNSTYKINEISYRYRLGWPNSGGTISAIGRAPDWLPAGTYYSADGSTFYTDIQLTKPVKNGKNVGTYVNYFQYLPLRSKSNITASELDNYIVSQGYKSSIYKDLGSIFIENGKKYGINPLLVHAMANLESAYGTSSIAKNKYNIFGWNAVDSNPGQATAYDGINEVVDKHMGHNLRGYTSLNDWRFFGYSVGNKGSGFNVMYASDPYWGMKIASIAYRIDRAYGFKDLEVYELGKLKDNTPINVRSNSNIQSSVFYTTPGDLINQYITVLNTQNDFYQTYSAYPIVNGQIVTYKNSNQQVEININENLAYISSSLVDKVPKLFKQGPTQIPKDIEAESPKEPDPSESVDEDSYSESYKVIAKLGLNIRSKPSSSSSKIGSLAYNANVKGKKAVDGWVEIIYNNTTGYISEEWVVSDELNLGDVNQDGRISNLDLVAVRRHLLGLETLTGRGLVSADANKDGRVSNLDLVTIRRHLLGLETLN